jgi:uroporphyrinogen-III synthase
MADGESRRVLVTRPEPGAGRTAARLRQAGFEPVVMPLSEIVPLQPEPPAGMFDAVAASSANALRHAPARLLAQLAARPLYAAGDETAAAARAAGFMDVRSSSGSAVDLVRDLAAAASPGTRIAYLCGRVRLDAVEAAVARNGVDVVAVEVYDTRPRTPAPAELMALERGPVFAALIYSAKAAESLAGLVRGWPGTIFAGTAFIAISRRVAEGMAGTAAGEVFAAATPDEDAMFDILVQLGHEPAPFPVNLA